MCAAVLLAVFWNTHHQPQKVQLLVDTDTLQVTREGQTTVVNDRVSDNTHVFTTKRVRRSNAPTEPYRAVQSNTLTVDILPGGGLKVCDLTAGKVYCFTLKKGDF